MGYPRFPQMESGPVLLQLRVLRFGLLQDGDVGIGVFPEGEKILVGSVRFGFVTSECTCPAQSQASRLYYRSNVSIRTALRATRTLRRLQAISAMLVRIAYRGDAPDEIVSTPLGAGDLGL